MKKTLMITAAFLLLSSSLGSLAPPERLRPVPEGPGQGARRGQPRGGHRPLPEGHRRDQGRIPGGQGPTADRSLLREAGQPGSPEGLPTAYCRISRAERRGGPGQGKVGRAYKYRGAPLETHISKDPDPVRHPRMEREPSFSRRENPGLRFSEMPFGPSRYRAGSIPTWPGSRRNYGERLTFSVTACRGPATAGGSPSAGPIRAICVKEGHVSISGPRGRISMSSPPPEESQKEYLSLNGWQRKATQPAG